MTSRHCEQCGGSLAGKRRDAKFCSVVCRVNAHRHDVGRVEPIASHYVIEPPMREALIAADVLNPQDEHDPGKVREAFQRMCQRFADKYA